MTHKWWSSDDWDDTDDEPTGTHTCRVCDHHASIETPQRRTRHFCRDCETWQPFVSVLEE